MRDYHGIAETWVTDFVDRGVKSRVLDGRPDRIFVRTLTAEIAQLLERECEVVKPARKGAKP